MQNFKKIDGLFLVCALILLLLIGGVLVRGNRTFPTIVSGNLEGDVIPLSTNQVVLTFSRAMDHASVEAGFSVIVPGKFSWIGRKMAYSFTEPLKAGQEFTVTLARAADEFGIPLQEEYQRHYRVSTQTLYYIGTEDDEKNRLVRYDLDSASSDILSPHGMVIKDFKVHPNGEIIFLLVERNPEGDELRNDLYRFNLKNGTSERILDGSTEFIFSFGLSPDGKILLVRKGAISYLGTYSTIDPGGLWIYDIASGQWSEFWNRELYGSEFYFSPDSRFLVGRLISGDITIVPIEEKPSEVIYLENYAGSYNLSPDGGKLVFVDFEDLFSPHDLLLRGNDGTTKTLVTGKGQIQFPVFNRVGDKIYFLMSLSENNFDQTGYLVINPYHLYVYDIISDTLTELTDDESYFEGFFEASSDGSLVAFERYDAGENTAFFEGQLEDSPPAAGIWVYDQTSGNLTDLGVSGTRPYLN